ncbi:TrpB-like pyridoxal phosphate-dependent enzyme [Steroidobacter cummioxidans]|uniref:TrpB-like pyridoxal phosphate-dependent enzyme n=1 Tax=Steroidobacter cummioxidans TaxID=1803913 RepID=UPI000E31D6DB|nr:TrpB-like pyridoxal phosphate-dependent enzyme [Steroidobacter cummioxidans]
MNTEQSLSSLLPKSWYNLVPELDFKIPKPLHPVEERLASVEDFNWLWSSEALRIEFLQGEYASNPWIDIPQPVLEAYSQYRPTQLYRARGLEKHIGTRAEIYLKREDQNPAGSHKLNTALPQAFYAKSDKGVTTLVTDTGAGQWGSALSMASSRFGLATKVFMTRKSYDDKPYRRFMMRMTGAEVYPSPSSITRLGRQLLEQDPDQPGSLGIGMSEAIELVRSSQDHRLALGCMSYYAVLHQTVIGIETKMQLEALSRRPTYLLGCVGGGSNFAGFIGPFVKDKVGGSNMTFVACEPENIATLTSGDYRYDWADYGKHTPRISMYTLGHDFQPPKIHSGGLRYHGKTPVLSALVKNKIVATKTVSQPSVFEAGQILLKTEGILPAPESSHAIKAALDIASNANAQDVIVVCLSGHGYLDLKGYADELSLE